MDSIFQTEFNRRMAEKSWTPAHMSAALADRGHYVTVQAIMRWAEGSAMPRAYLLSSVADALGCTPNDMLIGANVQRMKGAM